MCIRDRLVKKLCDGVVSLDMAARGTGVDSFNVSVAAGIILYEIQSQRAAQMCIRDRLHRHHAPPAVLPQG